jgi:iron(III) transport system substrate-binding protein
MRHYISFLILTFFLFIACKKQQPEVVVYNTVDQIFSEPVLQDFEKETGIKVRAIFDTEETKSTGILNRLLAEKDNPQADVFWSGDPVRTIVLKDEGILANINPENAQEIPAHFRDSTWIGFSARARVLIYNKNLLAEDAVPKSIFDLTNKRYRGVAAIANPLFGTTTFHVAALFSHLGDEKARQFMQQLKDNNIVIASSNGDVRKRVASGELALGLTDTDDAFEAIEEGAPVGIVFLDQEGMGTLIMPNTVSLIEASPNTENGKRLIEYLLQKETEAKLAQLAAQMPLHKGVPVPQRVPSLDNIRSMKIDYGKTASKLQEIQPFLKSWVE